MPLPLLAQQAVFILVLEYAVFVNVLPFHALAGETVAFKQPDGTLVEGVDFRANAVPAQPDAQVTALKLRPGSQRDGESTFILVSALEEGMKHPCMIRERN